MVALTPEPWYAPEVRALSTFANIALQSTPLLVVSIPSIIHWWLILCTHRIKSHKASFGLAVASTLLCLLIDVELDERRFGFLASDAFAFESLRFWVWIGTFQFLSAFFAFIFSSTDISDARQRAKAAGARNDQAVGAEAEKKNA